MRFQPLLDLGARNHARDLLPVTLVDLIRRGLNRRLGVLLLVGEERFEVFAQRVEQIDVVGEFVEHPMNDLFDLLVQRVLAAHRRRPADAGVRERVDHEPRRMRLLGEERAVEHRRLQHRNLQATDQHLHAVG